MKKLPDMSDMANERILQQQKKVTVSQDDPDKESTANPTMLAWHVLVSQNHFWENFNDRIASLRSVIFGNQTF